jgi:hypothetical protein
MFPDVTFELLSAAPVLCSASRDRAMTYPIRVFHTKCRFVVHGGNGERSERHNTGWG